MWLAKGVFRPGLQNVNKQRLLTSSLLRKERVTSEEFHGETKPIFTVILLLSALPAMKEIIQSGLFTLKKTVITKYGWFKSYIDSVMIGGIFPSKDDNRARINTSSMIWNQVFCIVSNHLHE